MSDRKVVLKMVMSLDGFVTSPDGTHEWMFEFFGDDSGEWNRRALDAAGVHAMGRRSYEIMGPHWAASEGPIATAMNEKPKAVFSRTLAKAEWGPAEIFGGNLGAEIADLKGRDDQGTVLAHGGPDFAKSLTRLGLVDEYQLTTVPIAIGAGHSPFAELGEHLKLDVVEEQRFQSGALRRSWCRSTERPPELNRGPAEVRPRWEEWTEPCCFPCKAGGPLPLQRESRRPRRSAARACSGRAPSVWSTARLTRASPGRSTSVISGARDASR